MNNAGGGGGVGERGLGRREKVWRKGDKEESWGMAEKCKRLYTTFLFGYKNTNERLPML